MIALALGTGWVLALALAFLDSRRPLARWVFVGGMGAVLATLVAIGAAVSSAGPSEIITGGWSAEIGIRLRADMLGVTFATLTTFVLLVSAASEVLTRVQSRSFLAFTAFMAAGLNGLFLTADVFNFYVFFEVSMAAAFGLTAHGERPRQMRAAFTFVVVNLFGSLFFVAAVAGLYRGAGTLDMPAIALQASVRPEMALPAGVLLLLSFGLKLGLFPFHMWVPPVYRDTDPAVAAMLAGALANIGSYGLLRFGAEIVPGAVEIGQPLLIALGLVSLLYGALLACSTKIAGEVLAYSSIGQAGYVLLAVALGGRAGFAAAVLYAVINSVNKMQLFLAGNVRGPLIGFAFAVAALSVAGVPPSAGFFAKASVFRAAIATGHPWAVVVVALGGVLSLVYMFPLYQRRFWRREDPDASALAARGLLFAISLLILAAGLWPEPLLGLSEESAAVLLMEQPQ